MPSQAGSAVHILHLTPYYAPAYAFGGVVRAVEGMARSMSARGHEVTVLSTDALDRAQRYPGPAREPKHGVHIRRQPNLIPLLRSRLNLSSPRKLRAAASELLPTVDLLHVHEFRTLENLLVVPQAHARGIPIVLSPHGTLSLSSGRSRLKVGWDRIFSRRIARHIAQVFCLNTAEQADAQALWNRLGAHESRFSIVPNGVCLAEFAQLPTGASFRARYGLQAAPTVLFMGRLHARKGADILIRAFRAAGVDDARLLLAGPDDGMLLRLQALAGDDQRIVFTGYLDGQERLEALAAADVFALLATGEGQPVAVLEALAAGIPALLSPGCHLDELAAAGAALVVAAEESAVAQALRRLLADAALRQRMGQRGRECIAEHYAWPAIAAQLEQCYKDLL